MIQLLKNLNNKIKFSAWSIIHQLPSPIVYAWQSHQLKKLLGIAYDGVPFYTRILKESKINPDSIKTRNDIDILPIMDKRTLKQQDRNLLLNWNYQGKYIWRQTSGTTGEPFRFPITLVSAVYGDKRYYDFTKYRFLFWEGFNKNMDALKVAHIGFRPMPLKKNYLFIPVSDVRKNARSVISKLGTFQPFILESVPTILAEVGRTMAEAGVGVQPIKIPYIISYGENLSYGQRYFIENILSNKGGVYDLYGLEEFGPVGMECAEHKGFHINEESFIVEIINNAGGAVANGESGHVVLTHFYNRIMPFIRYKTGDIGVILKKRCRCGVRSKRLFINGRDGIALNIGQNHITLLEISGVINNFDRFIVQYQLARITSGRLELRIIANGKVPPNKLESLKRQLKDDCNIITDIKIVSYLPNLTNHGKTVPYVDESL
ncbi:MAG: hypothetical protein Q7R91_02210 [bacterium]|nr:hypothetical protein [bacterium]